MNTINTHLPNNSDINFILRPDQGRISISGPQADTFLEGQLTCGIKALPPLGSTLGGYCNTQGRLISLFRLFKNLSKDGQTEYWLDCPLEIIDSTIKTLKKYAMFSQVSIKKFTPHSDSTKADQSALKLTPEVIQLKINDILNKIPQLSVQTQGLFLPHHVDLPQLGGVSFTKGCYLGQEIIARMEYRGKIKKHLAILKPELKTQLKSDTDLTPDLIPDLIPGTPIYSTTHTPIGEPVGHIVNSAEYFILASILDSSLEESLYISKNISDISDISSLSSSEAHSDNKMMLSVYRG